MEHMPPTPTLQVFSPYDGSLIDSITMHTKHEAQLALETAVALHRSPKNWLPAHQRIAILQRFHHLLNSSFDALVQTAILEGGKPYRDTVVEMQRAINGVELAIAHIPLLTGSEVPMSQTPTSSNRMAFTIKEPIGVVVAISAFNHPINLIIHQVVTAIAAGCPVIIKPALSTPLSCLTLVNLLLEAGLPNGYCQALILDNETTEWLATQAGVAYVSFIGSAKVGWQLRSQLAPGTRCALEHGGAAPAIVHEDADLTKALPALVKGGFYHAGQVCVSVQRVYLHQRIRAAAVEQLVQLTQQLNTGDPLMPATDVGPIINTTALQRIHQWVTEAIEQGATLLCGGHAISESLYAPTLLLNPPKTATISQQEVFGPVMCLYDYDQLSAAIDDANALEVHFQSAIFTENLQVALQCIRQLNDGTVLVNDHTAFRVDWMPFGGRDVSGLGMGGIQWSMDEMTRLKMMVFKETV